RGGADRDEDRREEWRGRRDVLAREPHRVPEDRERERSDPFRRVEHEVLREAADEADQGPFLWAAEHREHDRDEVEELGLDAQERELGEDRGLQQQGRDDHGDQHDRASHGVGSSARRASTRTYSSVEKSTAGRIVTYDSTESGSLNARETVPIRS